MMIGSAPMPWARIRRAVFPAVEVVHRDVEQHRVGLLFEHAFQALVAARRLADPKAQRQQHAGEHLALGRVVVDHQQRAPRADVAGDGPVRRAARLGRLCGLAEVQPDGERTAVARRALHRELAAHQLGQQVGDRQPEAGAGLAGAAAGAAALEGQEDAFEVLLGDADAGVDDLEARHLALVVEQQGDRATLGETDGVAEQVEQDLAQQRRTATRRSRARGRG